MDIISRIITPDHNKNVSLIFAAMRQSHDAKRFSLFFSFFTIILYLAKYILYLYQPVTFRYFQKIKIHTGLLSFIVIKRIFFIVFITFQGKLCSSMFFHLFSFFFFAIIVMDVRSYDFCY